MLLHNKRVVVKINRLSVTMVSLILALFLSVPNLFQVSALAPRATKTTTTRTRQVIRVDKKDFEANLQYFHSSNDEFLETPVIVSNVLDALECEQMCEVLMMDGDSVSVNLQRKQIKNGTTSSTEFYPCTLEQGVRAIMDSSHDDSRLIFEEGLLEDNQALHKLSQQVTTAQQSLFTDEDWLEYFPSAIKPSSCVVVAGEGATSTLHRDPLEWTGTSLCLEGTKVWRFLAPLPNVTSVDTALKSYRLNSIAWDEYNTPLSAGWQSDCNLYDRRHADISSAQELDGLPPTHKYKLLQDIASDTTKLQPNLPSFFSPTSIIWTAVQRPGDLVVVPAHWWHQTYGLEPSFAIASQRCGTQRDAPRLVRHVLETTNLIDNEALCKRVLRETYENESPKDVVGMLFDELALLLK